MVTKGGRDLQLATSRACFALKHFIFKAQFSYLYSMTLLPYSFDCKPQMVGWLCHDMFRNRIAFSHFKPSLSKTYCHFMRQSIERQVTHASRFPVFAIARNLQKSKLTEMMKQWWAMMKYFKIVDWIEETMWTRWDENNRHSLGPQPHRSTKKDWLTVQRECNMFRQNKNSLFMPHVQRNVCTTKKGYLG